MLRIENILDAWQLVPLTFAQSQIAATQTAVPLYPIETATPHVLLNVGFTMPFRGEIVSVTVNLSGAATAGTLTVVPTIGGTVVTTPSAVCTTAATGTGTCRRGKNPFPAGSVIGAKLTTSAAWNGTARDLQVVVWVILDVEGI